MSNSQAGDAGDDTDATEVAAAKTGIRRAVIAARDAMPPATRAAESARCFQYLLARAEFKNATSVLSYISFGSEIDTRPVFEELLRRGQRLILPRISRAGGKGVDKCVGGGESNDAITSAPVPALTLHRVTSYEDLVPGVWGIDEPRAGCPQVALSDIDFALVPGVAFDRSARRLGYGKGYYDRLLANRSASRGSESRAQLLVAAIAFDCQLVDHVPVTASDQMIDLLITPLCQIPFKP